MNNGISDNLKKLIQINNSLDNINRFNDINSNNLYFYQNHKANDKERINTKIYLNNSIFNEDFHNNNFSDSPLNEIININKGIDSIYDSIQLMKSNNKINSKILYQISHSSQTLEGY